MNQLLRYEPLTGRLDGLFDDLFRPALRREGGSGPAPIRIDVRETPDAYAVRADIAGVRKEDIHVEIEGNEVLISAEVQRESGKKEGERVLRAERFSGKTARRFALPQEIDQAKAEAKYADGVLELALPKKVAVAGRRVAIQ
ncbi:MAG TPA: Hsp20/alpha crystallin family protein [Usitatibacteraceae bacterium]|nr:Hsp20/alpha crystallin family protein [Usitatibacteraceae bacterium]